MVEEYYALKDRYTGYGTYKRSSGEAEARLTQARKDMTAAERAKSYPPDMFDVPVEDQIVSFGGGKQMMSEGKKLTEGEKIAFMENVKSQHPEMYNASIKSLKYSPKKNNIENLYSTYKTKEAGRKADYIERNKPKGSALYRPLGRGFMNYLEQNGFKLKDSSIKPYGTADARSTSMYYSNGSESVRVSDHSPVNMRSNILNNFYPGSHKSEKDAFKAIDKIISNKNLQDY